MPQFLGQGSAMEPTVVTSATPVLRSFRKQGDPHLQLET